MTAQRPSRDVEIEAFVLDRYLESLLSRTPLEPDGSMREIAADLPADVRATAGRLVRDLPRYHPSFRFEEALAARLAAVAASPQPEGALIDFPVRSAATIAPAANDLRGATVRPVVISGVLTSAAISLAGAAYVAWRRSRQSGDPMARAARAVARARAI